MVTTGEFWSPLGHLYTRPLILSASLSLRHMRNLSQSPSMGNTPLVGQLYTSIRLSRIFLFPSSEVTTVGLGLCVVVVVVTSIFNCFSGIECSLTQTVFGFKTTQYNLLPPTSCFPQWWFCLSECHLWLAEMTSWAAEWCPRWRTASLTCDLAPWPPSQRSGWGEATQATRRRSGRPAATSSGMARCHGWGEARQQVSEVQKVSCSLLFRKNQFA